MIRSSSFSLTHGAQNNLSGAGGKPITSINLIKMNTAPDRHNYPSAFFPLQDQSLILGKRSDVVKEDIAV